MSMGRAGQPGRQPEPLPMALEARALLQEQFYRVDQYQNDIGGTIKLYVELLPDRAARTGVVPGWRQLDERATGIVMEYLGLLDRYDPVEELPLVKVHEARVSFGQLTPRVQSVADEMDRFLGRFSEELQRVGEVRQRVEQRVTQASEKVAAAERAWSAMRAGGAEFPQVDEAVARARIAGRKLVELAPRLAPHQVDEPAAVVDRLAEEAIRLATDLPKRVATLGTRIPSLATRIDALETRASGVPEAMGALRREFSLGNWNDIANREQDVTTLLGAARTRLRDLRRLHESGDIPGALAQLDLLDSELATAGEVIDGPRRRLDELRAIKANPQQLLERTKFALRDARYLIMKGRQVAPQPWAGRLDAAAHELISLEDLLKANHPDYLALQQRTDSLNGRIKALVDEVRGRS